MTKFAFANKLNLNTEKCFKASLKVANWIAKTKKPHTIAEELVKPCLLEVIELLFGKEYKTIAEKIPLSNSTIKRRINEISDLLLEKTIDEILNSDDKLFSMQIDETTDLTSNSQLLVFVRYMKAKNLKRLFCSVNH